MVYLIDDKKTRQESDYLWSTERFGNFKNVISCIYTLQELEYASKEVFSNDNIILYHESFIDQTNISEEAIDKRNKLYTWSENKRNIIVYFSGSKNFRKVNDNIAHIPVSTLYSNLEIFLLKISTKDINLDYLVYGANVNLEKELRNKQTFALKETFKEEPSTLNGTTLFLCDSRDYIFNPFVQFVKKELFADVSDEKFNEIIKKWLNDVKYDYIYLPLCFGNILSDYNGLRLSCHIRCTKSKNQTTQIFIYGIVGADYILKNEYFNILKTKSVELIPFSKKSFGNAVLKNLDEFYLAEIPSEVSKLKLDVPQNYEDNHSLSNEWAIYRWANIINTKDEAIVLIEQKINSGLYFKYLQTIYPISRNQIISDNELKIHTKGKQKILYIDDEAEKGWYEVFCKIIVDINNIEFYYLDKELDSKTQLEIVDISLKKIKELDIDVVILDFRLHPNDTSVRRIDDVTGLKLLKKIKLFNPGIQVIMFSATNKIWNLQALQDEGLDGFILKESPENSIDLTWTSQVIKNFLQVLERSLSKCFIKRIYPLIDPIGQLLKIESEKHFTNFSLNIRQPLIQSVNQRIGIFYKLLYNFNYNLEFAFSTLILAIEEIVNELYKDDEGHDHFVEVDIFNIVKCNYMTPFGRELSIKPNFQKNNYTNEVYLIPTSDLHYYDKASNRDPFNFRLTCILHYRYNIPLGSTINKYYKLYDLRSKCVMHVGTDRVSLFDIELSIELLKILIK